MFNVRTVGEEARSKNEESSPPSLLGKGAGGLGLWANRVWRYLGVASLLLILMLAAPMVAKTLGHRGFGSGRFIGWFYIVAFG